MQPKGAEEHSCCGSCTAEKPTRTAASPNPVRDPVCGMTVDPANARASASYADKTYFFCSERCRETFAANPSTYLPSTVQP